jgi:hypothetical protein
MDYILVNAILHKGLECLWILVCKGVPAANPQGHKG